MLSTLLQYQYYYISISTFDKPITINTTFYKCLGKLKLVQRRKNKANDLQQKNNNTKFGFLQVKKKDSKENVKIPKAKFMNKLTIEKQCRKELQIIDGKFNIIDKIYS